jgi:hypothetical protein
MSVVIHPFDLPAEYQKPAENWKRPVRNERGDRDWLTLYVAVGRALSQWEALEICLGELFMLLVESPSLAASRAYGALGSVPARKSALEFAAEEFFDTFKWINAISLSWTRSSRITRKRAADEMTSRTGS